MDRESVHRIPVTNPEHTMQTIATKLAAVRKHAAGWNDHDLRCLIHGVGGSPRRARRVLKADAALAKMLAEQYATAIESGTHHVHAVKACNESFLAMFAPSTETDTEAAEGGEGEDESEAEPDMTDYDAIPVPKSFKVAALYAANKAGFTLTQSDIDAKFGGLFVAADGNAKRAAAAIKLAAQTAKDTSEFEAATWQILVEDADAAAELAAKADKPSIASLKALAAA